MTGTLARFLVSSVIPKCYTLKDSPSPVQRQSGKTFSIFAKSVGKPIAIQFYSDKDKIVSTLYKNLKRGPPVFISEIDSRFSVVYNSERTKILL